MNVGRISLRISVLLYRLHSLTRSTSLIIYSGRALRRMYVHVCMYVRTFDPPLWYTLVDPNNILHGARRGARTHTYLIACVVVKSNMHSNFSRGKLETRALPHQPIIIPRWVVHTSIFTLSIFFVCPPPACRRTASARTKECRAFSREILCHARVSTGGRNFFFTNTFVNIFHEN